MTIEKRIEELASKLKLDADFHKQMSEDSAKDGNYAMAYTLRKQAEVYDLCSYKISKLIIINDN